MIPHPDQARTRSATTIPRRRAAAVEHVPRDAHKDDGIAPRSRRGDRRGAGPTRRRGRIDAAGRAPRRRCGRVLSHRTATFTVMIADTHGVLMAAGLLAATGALLIALAVLGLRAHRLQRTSAADDFPPCDTPSPDAGLRCDQQMGHYGWHSNDQASWFGNAWYSIPAVDTAGQATTTEPAPRVDVADRIRAGAKARRVRVRRPGGPLPSNVELCFARADTFNDLAKRFESLQPGQASTPNARRFAIHRR